MYKIERGNSTGEWVSREESLKYSKLTELKSIIGIKGRLLRG